MTRSMGPVEFEERVLRPALARSLDRVFPEFGFVAGNDGWWKATRAPAQYAEYGAESGKLTAREWGFRTFRVRSDCPPMTWLAYVNGGTTPRGRDYVEKLKEVARRVGLSTEPIERDADPAVAEAAAERERRSVVFETFLAVTRTMLNAEEGCGARDYFVGRGFGPEAIERYELGFFATSANVRKGLADRGVSEAEIDASGLVGDSRWEGRVVGAWRGPSGRIGQFFARDLSADGDADAKYLYVARPPNGWGEARLALVAFGIAEAAVAVRRAGEALVVESVMAVLKLRARGVENVFGVGGDFGQIGVEKWQQLAASGVSRAVLLADNDKKPDGTWPGREGLIRAIDHLADATTKIKVEVVDPAALADVKGPDDYLDRHGIQAFRGLLTRRQPAAIWRATTMLDGVESTVPDHVKRDAVERVAAYTERVLRGPWSGLDTDAILNILAERTGYDPAALRSILDDVSARATERKAGEALDRVLSDASTAKSRGEDPRVIARAIEPKLAVIRGSIEVLPPRYSVDRILDECRNAPAGVGLGFRRTDEGLGFRLYPGELVLFGARTGHGKTTMVKNVHENMVRRAAEEAASGAEPAVHVYYSAEEPAIAAVLRSLARRTAELGVPWTIPELRDFHRGGMASRPGYGWPLPDILTPACDFLRRHEPFIEVVYCAGWSVEQIVAHAHRFVQDHRLGSITVDYVQRIRVEESVERRDLAVSAVGRKLKDLAVALNLPVLASVQINREAVRDAPKVPQGRPFDDEDVQAALRARMPQLHHLREGGSEQEADQVLGLLYPAADFIDMNGGAPCRAPGPSSLFVVVLKRRFGACGAVETLQLDASHSNILDEPVGEAAL